MFSIKKMLVDLYDSRTAQSCSASIGDIMNLRRNVEHNQFLATTRYLDIKDYVEYNKQTFVWQKTSGGRWEHGFLKINYIISKQRI